MQQNSCRHKFIQLSPGNVLLIGVTFSKSLWGPSKRKVLKVNTIKILVESDFSSNLTLYLPTLGGLIPLLGGGSTHE